MTFFVNTLMQGCDAVDLVLRERRVFFGYPPLRYDIELRRGHLRKAVVDLMCPDEEWKAYYAKYRHYDAVNQLRNLVRKIGCGDVALVPRPGDGVVHVGIVVRPFELVDDPPWGDDYLRMRADQGHAVEDCEDEMEYILDVAQCCTVDAFRTIPIGRIPEWISRQLQRQASFGRIYGQPRWGLAPHPALIDLIAGQHGAESR